MKKHEFYPLVKELLEKEGYRYYREEDIRGKGRGARKPDFVAIKNNLFLIGEIKSPSEPPNSASWRSIQPYDTENMKYVREMVKNLEKQKKIPPEVGGNAIIMLGQIPEYMLLMHERWIPPEEPAGKDIIGAYAFPSFWKKEVERAINFFKISTLGKIENPEVCVFLIKIKVIKNLPNIEVIDISEIRV